MRDILGFKPEELTFAHILPAKAKRNGEKVFMTELKDRRTYSYRDIDTISTRIANGLLVRGIGKGDHVAVMMNNSAEQVLIFFAICRIGAVLVPINPAAHGSFLQYFLSQSRSIALFIDEDLIPSLATMPNGAANVRRVFVFPQSARSKDPPIISPLAPEPELLAALLDSSDTPIDVPVAFTDLGSIMYTSGTTGPSKGNMFSQAHTLTFGWATRRVHGCGPDDVYYVSLPLFHAAGWNTFTLGSLLDDASIVIPERFSVTRFWEDIREHGCTVTSVAGVGHFLLAQPERPDDADNPLRICMAAPMMAEHERFKSRFGVALASAYGLSDFAMIAALGPGAPAEKIMSCGKALEGVTIRVADEDDFEVPAGTPGEVLVQHAVPWCTASGYYDLPDPSAAALRNGWYHTGDRGYVDDDGYLFFLDRKKDALRRRGENISAFELEQVLVAHPDVKEVAIVAVRCEEGTEDEVGAAVILHEGRALSFESFIAFCCEKLPYFMVPRFVEFCDEYPRTLTQKVQKEKVRESMHARLPSIWDREKAGIVLGRPKH